MKTYKASNKRVMARSANGEFRKWTGADFGIGVCTCNRMSIQPAAPKEIEQRPADPRLFRLWQLARVCPGCEMMNKEAADLQQAGCIVTLEQTEEPARRGIFDVLADMDRERRAGAAG